MAVYGADPLAALGSGAVAGRYADDVVRRPAAFAGNRPAFRPQWAIVLGVEGDASVQDIKRAYRALALLNHPDHGGSNEAMGALNRAFEQAMSARTA